MVTTEVTEGEFKGWHTWPEEPFEYDTAGLRPSAPSANT